MDNKVTKIGFILGRDNALSLAEIFAVYRTENKDFTVIFSDKKSLVIESEFVPNINRLGGTIKIFNVLSTVQKLPEAVGLTQELLPTEITSRINFGISGYGVSSDDLNKVGFEIKDYLEKLGHKARFVTSKQPNLSSVIVTENKLLTRGFEMIIVRNGQELFVGKTISVQDYKAYSKRDFGRPARDDKSGMLPPKLAQILINLGEKTTDKTLYDPFCGSGTLIQEAIMLGYTDIIGSDISEKAIIDTKTNLNWLLPSHLHNISLASAQQIQKELNERIFISDILRPTPLGVIPSEAEESSKGGSLRSSRLDKKVQFDLVVGEGFLGEPSRRKKDKAIVDSTELTDFYIKAFSNIREMLAPGGRTVIAIPFFIIDKEFVYLPILEKIKTLRLKLIKPEIGIHLPGRGNLTYNRPDSFVGREILIVEK